MPAASVSLKTLAGGAQWVRQYLSADATRSPGNSDYLERALLISSCSFSCCEINADISALRIGSSACFRATSRRLCSATVWATSVAIRLFTDSTLAASSAYRDLHLSADDRKERNAFITTAHILDEDSIAREKDKDSFIFPAKKLFFYAVAICRRWHSEPPLCLLSQ